MRAAPGMRTPPSPRARSTASWGRRCTCGSHRSSSSAASARCRWRTSCPCLRAISPPTTPAGSRTRSRAPWKARRPDCRARASGPRWARSPRIPSSPPSSGLSGAASAPPSSRAPSSSSSTTSYSSSLRWCSASSCATSPARTTSSPPSTSPTTSTASSTASSCSSFPSCARSASRCISTTHRRAASASRARWPPPFTVRRCD